MKTHFAPMLAVTMLNVMTGILPQQGAWACPNSPDDETIIEYFNQIQFSEDIYINIIDTGTQFNLALVCPAQESPDFPPPNLLLTLYTSDNSTSITCNTGQIQLRKSQMHQLVFCQNNGRVCSFLNILANKQTQAVYCTTELMITFVNGNNTYIPNLNPATLPVCPQNFNPCVLTGQCNLSSDQAQALTLCESAECTAQPAQKSYTYDEDIYFQEETGP